jgi:hypothetical protein
MWLIAKLAVMFRKTLDWVITQESFECGHGLLSTKEITMDIGGAITALRSGEKVRRYTWKSGIYLAIKEPTPDYPFECLLMYHEKDFPHHWTPSKDELFAIDWVRL